MSLVALRVTCGSGKTYAAETLALERAAVGKRTAITSPTHAIAREQVMRLRAAGAAVCYRMAPHKVLDRATTGEPVCRRLAEAEVLSAAGLSVKRELCEGVGSARCRFRTTCTAAEGLDADDNAVVWCGPHALIGEAVTFAGRGGLLVVDEPPDAVNAHVITLDELSKAHKAARFVFYTQTWRAVIERVSAAIVDGGPLPAIAGDTRVQLADALKHGAPKVSVDGRLMLRSGGDIGDVRVLSALGRALLEAGGGGRIVRSEIRDSRLVIVELAIHMRHAIERARSTVLVDATLDVDALEALLGRRIDVRDIPVADGATVERVHVVCASATRRSWLPHGRIETKNLVGPLRRALEVVCEDPTRRTLGIVTFASLELPLRDAWGGSGPAELVEVLDPWRRRGGSVETLHYGGVRGRNDLAGVDALITLGDPWPDKLAAQARAEVLGLGFAAAYERAARAELAQAEGRIRAPRRTRAAIVVHVGRLVPDGWADARAVEQEAGRPRAGAADVRGDVLRAWRQELGLSQAAVAQLLGVGRRTVQRVER